MTLQIPKGSLRCPGNASSPGRSCAKPHEAGKAGSKPPFLPANEATGGLLTQQPELPALPFPSLPFPSLRAPAPAPLRPGRALPSLTPRGPRGIARLDAPLARPAPRDSREGARAPAGPAPPVTGSRGGGGSGRNHRRGRPPPFRATVALTSSISLGAAFSSVPAPGSFYFPFVPRTPRPRRGGEAASVPTAPRRWDMAPSSAASTPPARSPRYATPPVSAALPRSSSSSSHPSARHSRHLPPFPRHSLLKAHPNLLVLANRKARLTDGPPDQSQSAALRNSTSLITY
ncbi:basic proline-rich protein-like [Passer montanus]|uniref:basic proline-rich protein-like n=1 Tax=Passer montanus TaxID=9160 RepID=UPI00195F4B80|nr:basic proline-rich protein-like [Passer montanus]